MSKTSNVLFESLEPRVMLSSTLYVGAAQTYTTLQQAFNAVSAGDTIVVKNGTYRGDAALSTSGTASDKITIKAESGNSEAIIEGAVTIDASYVHIEGLTIQGYYGGQYRTSRGLRVLSGNSHNEVVKMQVMNFQYYGITDAGGNTYIADNYVYSCGGGIVASAGDVVERNTIEQMHRHGSSDPSEAPADYFRIFSSNATAGVIIRDNYCFGSSNSTAEVGDMHVDFIQSWDIGDISNVLVEGNYVTDFYDQGMMINNFYETSDRVHDWTVRNNVFDDYSAHGICLQQGLNFTIENNTFRADPDGRNGWYGVSLYDGSSATVRNNIFIGAETAAIYASSDSTLTEDYNLIAGGTVPSSYNTHDLVGTYPLFTDMSHGDFRLNPESMGVDDGQTLSFSEDLEDGSRPVNGTFDMGAYEYGSLPTLVKEAENMVVWDCSGDDLDLFTSTALSGDEGIAYRSNAVGDYINTRITFTTPGTYDLTLGAKTGQDRGIVQVALGTPGEGYANIGSPVDMYSGYAQLEDINVGQVTVTESGTYYLRFLVTGKNGSSSSYQVALDNIQLTQNEDPYSLAAPVDDAAAAISYTGSWTTVTGDSNRYEGTGHYTSSAGAYAECTFTGTGVIWVGTLGTNRGKADIYIDGEYQETISLFINATRYKQQVWSINRLSYGQHTIKVVCTGEKQSDSSGYIIAVDRFEVIQQGPSVVQDKVMDTDEATLVGTWTASTSSSPYIGVNYLHDGNTGKGSKSVQYSTSGLEGTYEIYAHWCAAASRASNTPIDIVSSSGTDTVVVNQRVNSGWNLLGTYSFDGSGSVTIRNTGTNGYVIADAVRFLKVSAETLDFNDYTVEQFSPSTQGTGGTTSVQDDGRTLYINGNGWKCIEIDYTVTSNTVIEFDFRSTDQGEIQSIVFAETNAQNDLTAFQLYGTDTWGVQTYNDYSGTEWVHYTIPVGSFDTGTMGYLVFVNDLDAAGGINSYFRDIQIYEA